MYETVQFISKERVLFSKIISAFEYLYFRLKEKTAEII